MHASYDDQVLFDMETGIPRGSIKPRDRELAIEFGYIWVNYGEEWQAEKKNWKFSEIERELNDIQYQMKKRIYLTYPFTKSSLSCEKICQGKVILLGSHLDIDDNLWSKIIDYVDWGYKNIVVYPVK